MSYLQNILQHIILPSPTDLVGSWNSPKGNNWILVGIEEPSGHACCHETRFPLNYVTHEHFIWNKIYSW